MSKTISLSIILMIFIFACGIYYFLDTAGEVNIDYIPTFKVKQVKFVEYIKANGEVEPLKQVRIFSSIRGNVVSLTPEGVYLHKGDFIFKVESDRFTRRINRWEERVSRQERRIAKDEKKIEQSIYHYKQNVINAENELKEAREVFSKEANISLKQELTQIGFKIKEIELKIQSVENEIKRKKKLTKRGFVSDMEMKKLLLEQKTYKLELALLENKKKIIKETLPLKLKKLIINIEQAENKYELAQKQLDSNIKKQRKTLKILKLGLQADKAKLLSLKRRLNKATCLAPIEGMLVYLKAWIGGEKTKIKAGSKVFRAFPLASVVDIKEIIIKGRVPESVFGDLNKGMKAEITVPSIKNRVFNGILTGFSAVAYHPKKKGLDLFYESYIDFTVELIDKKEKDLKIGMSVDIKFIKGVYKNVIAIPRKAIFKDEFNNSIVYIKKAGKFIKRKVLVSLTNPSQARIERGLKQGDIIALIRPSQDMVYQEHE